MIPNGKDRPLVAGTVPNVGAAMNGWAQPLTFTKLTKTVTGYEVQETGTSVTFQGVIQPFKSRDLLVKPEGQRAWSWYTLHADPACALDVDDVVIYLGKQTRVMAVNDFSLYGFLELHLVQDWTGAGP